MKKEFDEMLCQKYPKIFAQRNMNPQQTLMCWGFECGDGWYNLLDHLCLNLQSYIDQHNKQRQREVSKKEAYANGYSAVLKFYQGDAAQPSEWDEKNAYKTMKEGVVVPDEIPQVVAVQVKEKFGSLRFYVDGGDDYTAGMIRLAESISASMCESCGIPSKVKNNDGWLSNMCPVCVDLREQQRSKLMKESGFEE
jgi:hypothetical protein